MANQTFKVVGITVHGDTTKVRFTDDMVRRIKQFTKGGATRADFIELPSEMTKLEALKFMKSHQSYQSPSDQATIADALEDREKESKKGEVKVKVSKKKSEKAKPSLEKIKARVKKKAAEEVAPSEPTVGSDNSESKEEVSAE